MTVAYMLYKRRYVFDIPDMESHLLVESVQSPQFWDRRSPALLYGASAIFPLSHILQVHLWQSGYRIYNIDCSIRFNAFQLMDEALRRELPGEEILRSIMIQRAFTPYQILDLFWSVLRKETRPSQTLYFIFAPCKQFFDGDVQEEEAKFLLKKLTDVLSRWNDAGIPYLIVETQSYRSKLFQSALSSFAAITEYQWQLDSTSLPERKREKALQLRDMNMLRNRSVLISDSSKAPMAGPVSRHFIDSYGPPSRSRSMRMYDSIASSARLPGSPTLDSGLEDQAEAFSEATARSR
jgi:hypothetical protein